MDICLASHRNLFFIAGYGFQFFCRKFISFYLPREINQFYHSGNDLIGSSHESADCDQRILTGITGPFSDQDQDEQTRYRKNFYYPAWQVLQRNRSEKIRAELLSVPDESVEKKILTLVHIRLHIAFQRIQ